ncbi:MAG TPA: VOC family protein [Acidimicrobiales bacterium]|nr:VOC family protein [Acidimicrobiales bacterium]
MPRHLEILKVNHINQIVEDYHAALHHLQDLFGGVFLREIGANPVTAGCLVDVGGEIIELLAPKVLDKAEGKQLAKYGPHYQGVEIMVPSVVEALGVVKERGIETLLERGVDFYTRPSATQGVCLQVYDGDWHAETPPAPYENPKRSRRAWEYEHPIGFRGLHHLSFACVDLDEAQRFWCELTGGAVRYRARRASVEADAVGLDIGIPIELVAATGPGPIADYIDRYGPRIWATTFSVRDLGATAAYFASRGIELVPGDAAGTLMLPPERNLHVVYQFME